MSAYAIVDSHIHLYPRAEVSSLAWCNEQHPLYGQYSIDEYLRATQDLSDVVRSNHKLQGFIFIETDRKSSLETESGWEEPLRELDWIKRIADGTPRPGEGHSPQHARLCFGIVPWAPLPSGSEAMSKYVQKATDQLGSAWQLVKGFRYLVQDKPAGTMLTDRFIDSLKWMGQNGYAFDLGVDARSGGFWQLKEAVEMIGKAHDGVPETERVIIVINHMCKPDMRSRDMDGNPVVEAFQDWSHEMTRLASCSNVYMKISGGFSEMDALPHETKQGALDSAERDALLKRLRTWAENWLKVILTIFGPGRMMFGSDYPVCNVGGGGNGVSWMNWWSLVNGFVEDHMSQEDQASFWAGNALKAYGRESYQIPA